MKKNYRIISYLIILIIGLNTFTINSNAYYTATSQNASIYGETPFTQEYALGYFCINNSTAYGCIEYGDEWWEYVPGPWYTTTSKTRNNNIYIDHDNGVYMNGTYYDVREYIYVADGNIMGISGPTGEIACGNVNKAIREFHFYKDGHCGDSNYEIEFKGIVQLTDFDNTEGYTINNINKVYLTNQTNITHTGDNTWLGTVNNSGEWDKDTLWAEVYSKPGEPLILTYWAASTHGSGINFNGTNLSGSITYKPNGGSGNDIVQIVALGYNNEIYENSFTNNGIPFIKWNTEPNGNGISYEAGNEYIINNSMILYAIWDPTIGKYNINTTAGMGGIISNDVNELPYSRDTSVHIIPMDGYKISNVTVDGVNKGAISTYDFWNIDSNHTVIATFTRTSTLNSYLNTLKSKYSWITFNL